MTDLKKDNIIIKAWETIREDIKIKKIYFLPWIISIIFLTVILLYQVIYTYVVIFKQEEKAFKLILDVFHSGYLTEILVVWWIFLLIYIIIIPIFESGLIWYLNKKETSNWAEIKLSETIWYWFYRFLPMFEYSNLFSQFKFISIVNTYLFCLRFIWVNYINLLTLIFIIILFVSIIINLLCAYCKFEIVLNDKKAFESISNSAKITFLNLGLTIKIYFFMFIVSIRVVINFVVFLIFPLIITTAITYISSKLFLIVAVWFLSTIFIFLIFFLWYLWWVLEIFKTSIRYYTYLEWKKKLQEEPHSSDEHNKEDENEEHWH